ncbi:MAG: helix-turn-helix transcriptional regulator [Cyclobacteriaceae bacterium]|nr:helix-turn-helix transcriptional regulator [Cyclobacteriaceae bacterium]
MKRYKLDGTIYYCPVDLTLSVIGGRWKSLVFWNLRDGAKRYGEIKKILYGINDKMLTQVLRELEQSGIVNRVVCEKTPPKVEYSLTDEGLNLLPVMKQMAEWGGKYELQSEVLQNEVVFQ